MEDFFEMLVSIGICVVLPIMIVWLNTRKKQNETNRKTEIMLKAIEAGQKIDGELFCIKQNQIPFIYISRNFYSSHRYIRKNFN